MGFQVSLQTFSDSGFLDPVLQEDTPSATPAQKGPVLLGLMAKRKVLTRFHIFGTGLQDPIIFRVASVGSHYPFNRLVVPQFLPNPSHFSRFTPILTNVFSLLVLFTPNFCSFYVSGYFIDPRFLLYLFFGLPVTL